MIAHTVTTHATASPAALFDALADLRLWPRWDEGVDRVDAPETPARAGTRFRLKPKGGPAVTLGVLDAERPRLFRDEARLPFARMRTTHLLEAEGGGTRVAIRIETTGLLARLWDRVVARPQAEGAARQTTAPAAYAAGAAA